MGTASAAGRTSTSADGADNGVGPLAAIGIPAGLGLAAALTAASVWTSLGQNVAGEVSLTLAAAGLALSLALGLLAARRIARIARGRSSPASGARLHLRFVALFSFAAAAPAVIVAVFLGALLGRGVETWFSDRLKSTVENAASLARSYVSQAQAEIRGEVLAMSSDLNQAVAGFTADREAYTRYLVNQAIARDFEAAYVIDRQGAVLAAAESPGAPAYLRPAEQAFADADAGEVSIWVYEDAELLRAVTRLAAYPDAYLYVARFADPGIFPQLRRAEQSILEYRAAERRRARLQTVFALAYISTAALVLVAAIWLGLANAARISGPIGRLADAAGQVASGDLAARVSASGDRDELDALGRAFNRMTSQLQSQRAELINARHEAETHSRFISQVLSGVSAGVIGLDRDGRIVVANRSAAALIGAGRPLVGTRLSEVSSEFAEWLASPPKLGPERVDLVREGATVHLSVRRSLDPDGGVVLTFDDMTKLVAAQRHEAWKDVARRIAHEIKNPLTPIQLSAERLQRKYSAEIASDPDTFRRCTETILRQVGDIGRMVDEFSAFARMPAPRIELVDLAELVREAVFAERLAIVEGLVEAEGVEAPVWVSADARLMGQALANVVKNANDAVQARRERDGEPKLARIVLRVTRADGQVRLEVIDNGVGFPPQDRERLLEPYVTTRTKGTGLGLAIVRRIIEDHGGRIELDDAPGEGPGALVRFVLLAAPEGAPPTGSVVSDRESV